jgi:hypothetical protein
MSSNGTIIVQDNFSGGDNQIISAPQIGTGLWNNSSPYRILNNGLNSADPNNAASITLDVKSQNYKIEFKMNGFYADGNQAYIRPVFRQKDQNNFCHLLLSNTTIGYWNRLSGSDLVNPKNFTVSVPDNPVGGSTYPHNFRIDVFSEKIDFYFGAGTSTSETTAVYLGTAYDSYLIDQVKIGLRGRGLNSTYYNNTRIQNFIVTSIADTDPTVIFSDSFNRATTTAIGTTSPDIGSPYTQVAGNFGITTGYRGYSSDDVNANANIYKNIYPNSNNFRWEFDQVFSPLVNALSTGRLFRPVFRYCNNDGSNGTSTSYLWFALNSVGPILYYRTPQNSDTTVISAVGVTTLTAGTNYHFVVTVQNDNISLNLNGATIINQSGVTFNSKLMGNGNPITMSRVGFIYTKGSSEVSTYNTYLDNFTIYDLGANTAILGDGYAATDTQYKAKGLTITDTQSATDSKYKTFGITKTDINLTPIEYSISKGVSLTSISDTEVLSDTNKVVRGWIFNNSVSIIDGNYEKINNKEIVYLIGGKPIKINQTINKQISSNTEIEQTIYITAKLDQTSGNSIQIISNKNN